MATTKGDAMVMAAATVAAGPLLGDWLVILGAAAAGSLVALGRVEPSAGPRTWNWTLTFMGSSVATSIIAAWPIAKIVVAQWPFFSMGDVLMLVSGGIAIFFNKILDLGESVIKMVPDALARWIQRKSP